MAKVGQKQVRVPNNDVRGKGGSRELQTPLPLHPRHGPPHEQRLGANRPSSQRKLRVAGLRGHEGADIAHPRLAAQHRERDREYGRRAR